MEEQTMFSNVSKMSTTTIPLQHQVMIEKWMLVLLIVGCTSLVFLICFPIDFYLYRRRRRLARERKNLTMYRPQTQSNRAAQIHAKVTVAEVAAEIDFEEMNKKDRKVYRAQRGIMRFLSLIRKKDKQTLNHSKDFKSENSSECRVLTTPETSNTMAHSENKNHLDHSTSTRSQDFGEISRGEKDYVEINVPNSWKKSKELVLQDSKQFKYGEIKPQNNSSSTAYNPAESRSHIIPVKSRGTINFKPERSNLTSRDHTGSNRDIIVESKTEYGQSEGTKGELVASDKHSNIQSEDSGFYTHLSVEDTNREMYTPIQEFRDSDNETEFQHQENLVHSNSDQNISFTPKSAKVSFKSRKKGNVISPTNKLTSSLSEQFCIEEKENSTLSKARTLSLSTTFEEPSARSSKWTKKKDSILKKQSSDSMPELQRYQKEKF